MCKLITINQCFHKFYFATLKSTHKKKVICHSGVNVIVINIDSNLLKKSLLGEQKWLSEMEVTGELAWICHWQTWVNSYLEKLGYLISYPYFQKKRKKNGSPPFFKIKVPFIKWLYWVPQPSSDCQEKGAIFKTNKQSNTKGRPYDTEASLI